jgi:multiple sugar transport system substrate-binding protein
VITQQATTDENKVEASQVFINWISQQSIEWARAGQIPARNSVRESQEFEDLPEQSAIAQEVPYLQFVPPVPGIAEIQPETFEQAVNEAVLRQSDPQTALDEAAERADQLLEENRQKYET